MIINNNNNNNNNKTYRLFNFINGSACSTRLKSK